MSGIYIHFPFCKQKCHYCNFTSIASTKLKSSYVAALIKEINLRNDFFENENKVKTIYFGGGTPSILSISEIKEIFNALNENFDLKNVEEITFEVNPENLNNHYLSDLLEIGINRLSIGTQSFSNQELSYLGRNHNALQSEEAVKKAKQVGFTNISIDLIYGLPRNIAENPIVNINKSLELDVQHISAYALTLEDNTIFSHLIKSKKIQSPNDDDAASDFYIYMNELKKYNFVHYEISNFAKNGFHSKHNSSYWENIPYLGVGASAHSFNIKTRSWNTSNISNYINSITSNQLDFELEELSLQDSFNDYVLTAIRTNKGIDLNLVKMKFGNTLYLHLLNRLESLKDKSHVDISNNRICLSNAGKFFADSITAEFMFI